MQWFKVYTWKMWKKQAPKWSLDRVTFNCVTFNQETGTSSIQSNPVNPRKIAFPSINSGFGYLTSKGLLITVQVPLAHEAGGTDQKYHRRGKKGWNGWGLARTRSRLRSRSRHWITSGRWANHFRFHVLVLMDEKELILPFYPSGRLSLSFKSSFLV